MKIMQVNAVYGIKSTGRTCSEVEKALVAAGHDCITVYGNGKNDYGEKAILIDKRAEYLFHNIASRITGWEGYFSYFATKRLIRLIKEYKPNVIHLRVLHGHYLNFPLLFNFLKDAGIPVVQHLHDCWSFTGKCGYYSQIGCEKWKTGCSKCPKVKDYPQSLFFDRTKQEYADKKRWYSSITNLTVIGVSDWVANEARKSFLNGCGQIIRIYNWVNQDIFKVYPDLKEEIRKEYKIPSDKFVIIGVSADWVPGTPRYEDFLKLADKIDNQTIIVMVGKTKEPINHNKIYHIPFVSNTEKLAKLYNCADVYVHASIEDTFGKVIAEALACGLPAIVYNTTGCAEIVDDSCGFKVEPRNIDQIIHSIEKIKGYRKNEYRENAVKRVDSLFSYSKNVSELIDLYEKLYRENLVSERIHETDFSK